MEDIFIKNDQNCSKQEAPQWMVDMDRNIYNARRSSKELIERINAREKRQKMRNRRRYNRYGRTYSDKQMNFYNNFYFSSSLPTKTTKSPTKPKTTRNTYIPNVTVGSVPKDDLFYEKLFNPVTRVMGATRQTFIPNVRIAHFDRFKYTTPKNYMDNYEIPIMMNMSENLIDKKQQNEVTHPKNKQKSPTMIPFNSHPNYKNMHKWTDRLWSTWRPKRRRRTYATRSPNATFPTHRNFESPVTWPDGHIEPPYDYSMTNKTYPPSFYKKFNDSFYKDYYDISHEGWVDSEYHRWHGQRAAGLPLESLDDDYYSEYANWYLKKRENSTEDRMFEVHDSNSPRTPRPTSRSKRRKKKFREVSDVSGFSEYERGFKQRLDDMFKNIINKVPDTTDKNIYKAMNKYMRAMENDSVHNEMLKSLPFENLIPPESFFHTTTSEACDTSSMQRYFIQGLPAYPEKEKAMKRRMALRMRRRRKQKMEMEEYKKQMAEMKYKIDKLTADNKEKDRGLFEKLYGKKQSFMRNFKINFLKNPRNKKIADKFKEKVQSMKNLFSFAFKKTPTTTVKPMFRIF
uniref:Uncharacterized protein n=2 Tax=Clastoptera arizonana TaxID=38151 RepID=A0A1B6DD55_9HEMI